MKKLITLSAIAFTTLFMASGCSQNEPKMEAKKEVAHPSHWSYEGKEGPANWGNLDKTYHMCAEGKEQTPINIIPNKESQQPLELSYTQGSHDIINNGHTVQVNMENGDTFTIDGVPYTLKQFHFHTPSENHVNGNGFPMEAHFVHASADGKLAVIAVMFTEGAENPTLGKIIHSFPLEINKAKELLFDKEYLEVMMPEHKDNYHFMGSLTTPPCSEKVQWFVLKEPIFASKVQIEAIHQEIGQENNRPIQPTNDREITE